MDDLRSMIVLQYRYTGLKFTSVSYMYIVEASWACMHIVQYNWDYKIGLTGDNQFHTGFAMEPVVKEASAPLADADSEEEEFQQPQAHSIPHSSPPTGTAGIGPTSHREEPLNEESGEEVEEELEHKAEKRHGELVHTVVYISLGSLRQKQR